MPAIAQVFRHYLPKIEKYLSKASSRLTMTRSRKNHSQLLDLQPDIRPSYSGHNHELKDIAKPIDKAVLPPQDPTQMSLREQLSHYEIQPNQVDSTYHV